MDERWTQYRLQLERWATLWRERCRCSDYDGGPYGGSIGDHFCSAGCPVHGPCWCAPGEQA